MCSQRFICMCNDFECSWSNQNSESERFVFGDVYRVLSLVHHCTSLVWLQDQRRQNAVSLRVSSLGARETQGGSGESRGNLFTVLRLNPNHLTIVWLTATLFNVIETIDCSIAHLRLLCSHVRDAQSQAALSKKDLFICPNHPINN